MEKTKGVSKMISMLEFVVALFTPGNIFIMLAILAVIAFFIMRRTRKRRLKEMSEEDEWMQSLDESEWE